MRREDNHARHYTRYRYIMLHVLYLVLRRAVRSPSWANLDLATLQQPCPWTYPSLSLRVASAPAAPAFRATRTPCGAGKRSSIWRTRFRRERQPATSATSLSRGELPLQRDVAFPAPYMRLALVSSLPTLPPGLAPDTLTIHLS